MFRSPSALMIRNLLRTSRPVSDHQCTSTTLSSLADKRLLSSTTTNASSKGELATIESSSSSVWLVQNSKKIVDLQDRDFLHHGRRPRFRDYEKFKSPRKRASQLYLDLTNEAIHKSKSSNPAVWETPFRVGDAIEMEVIIQGGIPQKEGGAGAGVDAASAAAGDEAAAADVAAAAVAEKDDHDKKKKKSGSPAAPAEPKAKYNRNLEKIRGVVLGIYNKKMDTSVLIRDVLFGLPVERLVPLHSPLILSLRVLEKNFVFKGKKRIKRAKLYYLSELNPLLTQVTGTKKWKREK